ncbi:hypothetical protein SASPL_138013 [Salvia splendens]|uniref:Cyclin-like domain-containing protein n=1 Tax=Salvia splendens TaxID=180675 RepID=A0A8X8WUI5_SALSN|nr:hypothetical protein SASPL_138013 [Salvia splendens]
MSGNKGFDCGTASDLLLCDDETKSLCFDDSDSVETFNHEIHHQTNGGKAEGRSEFIPLPFLTEECIGWMVEREREHLPRNDYLVRLRSGELDLTLRREALDWMLKACAHHKFGEFCLYLAVNYLDRFLSMYSLPGTHWVIQLIAVSCLSLAAKTDEVNVPSLVDLQAGEPGFVFEGKTSSTSGKQVMFGSHKGRCSLGIDFLEFKPSEIAAAVALYVSGEVDVDESFIQEKVGSEVHWGN